MTDVAETQTTPDLQAAREQLTEFENHYAYDASYIRVLMDSSPDGFWLFRQAQAMAGHRKSLPADAHFVACITTMNSEGCGTCAQLNLRMAVEAGVGRDILQSLIENPETLPSPLADVQQHTLFALGAGQDDSARLERLRSHFGDEAVAELAMCIAGARMYPTMKRALGKETSCQSLTLDF